MQVNRDKKLIEQFGNEWKAYNQEELTEDELLVLFNKYFDIFPFHLIDKNSEGFDMGCGSGRWASFIAPKVKRLNCIDPSKEAIKVARFKLKNHNNCFFENQDVMNSNLKDNSQDFGYSLGVLHHIPSPELGLINCTKKLKKGAPFLLYLYYRFDNKPIWFQILWKISDLIRRIISKMPFKLKLIITQFIALIIYYPLARLSLIIEKLGYEISNMPLSSYRKNSFYTMKTDALDRFGTKLEHRFIKKEIINMMEKSGLTNIKFSNKVPYWVAIGEKR